MRFLEQQGAEVIVTTNSEDKYLETKVASLISKWQREVIIKAINENPEFQINDLSVGSGNAGDPKTDIWLKKWWEKNKSWPCFVKRSFKTVRRIEGKEGEAEKITPPIDERLLADEFLNEFNRGNLSIKSLSLICPHCGSTLKSVEFVIFQENGKDISGVKCVNKECGKIIKDAGITLRYYCGYILPDSSAIQRRIISKDLNSSRFFEGYIIFCNSAFQWFKNLEKAIMNCYRALRRNGRIGIQAPAKKIYCSNFIEAIEFVKRNEKTKEIFSHFMEPWFFLETAEEYKLLFEKCCFKVIFSKIETITTEHTPEEVFRIFSSGAIAGYLNQDYYDKKLTENYILAFKEVVKKAFEQQSNENKIVKLKFNRIFLIVVKE